jgi:glycosyltransferase involved in cell wall biosynthesis
LKIIGEGPELGHLQNLAGPTIEFLGRLPDCQVAQQLSQCKALLFPGEEDFGIVPLEAAASGRPVIAFAAGGALETVINGTTGVLFPYQTNESLADAMLSLDGIEFDPEVLRKHAMGFNTTVFHRRMLTFLKSLPEVSVIHDLCFELSRAATRYFEPDIASQSQ